MKHGDRRRDRFSPERRLRRANVIAIVVGIMIACAMAYWLGLIVLPDITPAFAKH
jgi:hypothetical protein